MSAYKANAAIEAARVGSCPCVGVLSITPKLSKLVRLCTPRLQNLLAQYGWITSRMVKPQWSQTWRDRTTPLTGWFSSRIVLMASHVPWVLRRRVRSGRGSNRICSRRDGCWALADSFRRLARNTARRNSLREDSSRSPRRISYAPPPEGLVAYNLRFRGWG